MNKKKNLISAATFFVLGLFFFILPSISSNPFVERFIRVFQFFGSSYVFLSFSFLSAHLPIERRKVIANRVLISGLSIAAIGVLLKLLYLNGANICLAIGLSIIAFTYGTILGGIRKEKWQKYARKKWHVFLLSFGDITSIGLMVSGLLGKILFWTFADTLLIIGTVVLTISLLVWNRLFSSEVLLRREAEEKVKLAYDDLMEQHKIIEEKNKEILDSLNYAKRIQNALLAGDALLKKNLNEYFVLFKPKDVVSGDFYWATKTEEGFVYITADCTGHGVPGAFMSLLNISKLSEAINQKGILRPDLVLNEVRDEIIKAVNPEGSTETSNDGMDCVLCKIDFRKKTLEYSSANNAFYIVRNKELMVCKPDKMPVGKFGESNSLFTYNEIAIQSGDMVYTFTDGYADQFGGPKGKKFKYKQFEELLLKISDNDTEIQKRKLYEAFCKWQGNFEQVDDVCVIGVRIK